MSLTKITSDGIADGSIVNADLHSAANIDGTKIADNSIGGGKIPANQITNAHLATSTILRGSLSNNCIGTTEIIDTAVTLAKLEHGTSSNDGKFLRANNGADPTFETVDTTTNLGISTATDSVTVTSSTGNNAQISEASGSAAGVMSVAHHDKLDGIEASATADQTASEIRTLVGNASDSNVLTDALLSKLNGIEASATADQSAAEIRSLVESASDSNVFTDADHSKLNGIEASATADQTASEILTLIKTVDGSGSGLDADLLDGNSSSHYLNYNNLSNRPTVPTNNNQLSNGAGYMSGSSSQLVKAFVNYNGNNNSIRNDYNVSSITDHANGDQTVNFSSSISMSYTVSGMPIGHDHLGARCTNCIRGSSSSGPTRMNSTGVRIMRGFGSHNARQDGHTMCVAIHRP